MVKDEPMSKGETSIYNSSRGQSRVNKLCGSYTEGILKRLQVRKATVVH